MESIGFPLDVLAMLLGVSEIKMLASQAIEHIRARQQSVKLFRSTTCISHVRRLVPEQETTMKNMGTEFAPLVRRTRSVAKY